jgi:hypothetical protein
MDEPLKAKLLSRRRFLVGAGSAAVTLGTIGSGRGHRTALRNEQVIGWVCQAAAWRLCRR